MPSVRSKRGPVHKGHGGPLQGGVQASTSGALQRIKRPSMNHIRFIGLKNFPDRLLRAYPGSLNSWRGICSKSPEHDTDHGEADECSSDSRCLAFEVASQTTVTANPRER